MQNLIITAGQETRTNAEGSVLAHAADYYGIEKDLINLEVPQETAHYKPIGYKRLIDETMEMLDKNNLKIVSRRYQTNRALDAAIAYYNVEGPDVPFGFQIGWRNSYNRSMSFAFVSGVHVWICGNGMISGDETFRRKHQGTVSLDLRTEMQRQIDSLTETYERTMTDIELLQHKELNTRQMAELAGRLFIEKEVLSPTQMSALKREILQPSFDYSYSGYNFGNNDFYSLYQHGTYILKESNPYTNVREHVAWHEAIVELAKN